MVGCEKDKPNIVNTEDNNQYRIFDVHVQKKHDKSSMINYNLVFRQIAWNSNGRSYIDSSMFFQQTNSEGNSTFKIPVQLIKDSARFFYYIGSYIFDSTENGKYAGGIEAYHMKQNNNTLIEVTPICHIYVNTKAIDWEINKMDSIAVFNTKNYYTESLYNQWQKIELYYMDCSETNTIKYYYYSNGVKSKEYKKDIYVPFSSQDLDIVTCTLDFK